MNSTGDSSLGDSQGDIGNLPAGRRSAMIGNNPINIS